MNKLERLEQIRRLITERPFSKQSDLVEALKAEGVHATQATISRDMDELGVIKLPMATGGYRYSLSQSSLQPAPESQTTERSALVTILDVQQAAFQEMQMFAVSVVPGTSRLVKKLLLENYRKQILAVIADDDTVVIFARDEESARHVSLGLDQLLQ